MSEVREFQAETQKLLDLMIHSLYSHKEIFLRELISNASDALDRVRFAGLTDASLLPAAELAITLVADPEARTLSVEDNGIGMTREEVISQIGTIARSGTAEVLSQLGDRKDRPGSLDLIGQFGVGFYSSFMVADEVRLTTRKADPAAGDAATIWRSAADGRYTLDEGARAEAGTTVTLHLLPVDADAGLSDFTDEWVLRDVVKRYSDFVAYPIRLRVLPRDRLDDRDEKPAAPLNSMKAIWTRPPDEVGEEEHAEFYRHIAHDPRPPLLRIPIRIEGNFEARALLYVPSAAPFDLYHRERAHRGVQLYVKRVFIMDECRDLIPDYLRFVVGVVDAEDLSLNVSREILQHDAQIRAIRRHLTKKVLEALQELSKNDDEKYLRLWSEFGPVLKEGLLAFEGRDEKEGKKDRILELMRCASTANETKLTSLADYASRMPDHQNAIYYASGPSRSVLAASPQLEAFRARGIEVLLFSDPVDEVWLQQPPEYGGRPFRSAVEGALALGSDDEKKQAAEQAEAHASELRDLLATLRAAIQDEVKEVRLSTRLTESAACLVRDEGDLSPQIEAMLRQAGQDVPRAKPILELNPTHPLLAKLKAIHEQDGVDPRLSRYAKLLLAQAVLAGGGQLDDPAGFGRELTRLMEAAL
jgi:molecular chaperone HtpG